MLLHKQPGAATAAQSGQSNASQSQQHQHAAANSTASRTSASKASSTVNNSDSDADKRSAQRSRIRDYVYQQVDALTAASQSREALHSDIERHIRRCCDDQRLQLSQQEEQQLALGMVDEMLGLGPLQPLLDDESVNDILVNGPRRIFVERHGKLSLTDVCFSDEEHLFNTAQRIAAAVGRRIDEAHPMVDARLADGSRVNIISHPLALDGTSISIRKFMRNNLSLAHLVERQAMSEGMEVLLTRAMQARLNIVVSGGTGAGKTTLLNALSQHISHAERVVTIEDAAELQLQQPHVVRLETRPVSAEGTGKVDQRDLVKNSLRMRPDRIILGEVRGGESFDMLQAMNTGHDGSLCTVHANSPRDAIMRLENMVMMAGMPLPLDAIRRQIASAVDIIVQVERMRDGGRRIVSVTEVGGMEQDVIQTQELFGFEVRQIDQHGRLHGAFVDQGQRPGFYADHAHLWNEG